jgi:hypothetical protein
MSRRRDEWTGPRIPISIVVDGVTHHGHYQAEKRMIRVWYKLGDKATQLGGSPAESLARMILSEMVRETKG